LDGRGRQPIVLLYGDAVCRSLHHNSRRIECSWYAVTSTAARRPCRNGTLRLSSFTVSSSMRGHGPGSFVRTDPLYFKSHVMSVGLCLCYRLRRPRLSAKELQPEEVSAFSTIAQTWPGRSWVCGYVHQVRMRRRGVSPRTSIASLPLHSTPPRAPRCQSEFVREAAKWGHEALWGEGRLGPEVKQAGGGMSTIRESNSPGFRAIYYFNVDLYPQHDERSVEDAGGSWSRPRGVSGWAP